MNRGMKDLQSFALPLGHAADCVEQEKMYNPIRFLCQPENSFKALKDVAPARRSIVCRWSLRRNSKSDQGSCPRKLEEGGNIYLAMTLTNL